MGENKRGEERKGNIGQKGRGGGRSKEGEEVKEKERRGLES